MTALRSKFILLLTVLTLLVAGASAQTKNSGVEVELLRDDPTSMRVSIRSGAAAPVTIFKSDLPWEQRDRIILTAVTTAGNSIPQNVLAGDPSLQTITLNPGQSVSGEIDLKAIFKNLAATRRKSDIILFWAYRSPDGLNLSRWSGGWILIPQMR